MLTTLSADVDFALLEYTDSKQAEEKAERVWRRRKLLEDSRPQNPTTDEVALLKKPVKYFYKRYTARMKVRQKKKEVYDKRVAAKEKHKTDAETTERRENWVYRDGTNYNIRWSALPQ